MCATLSVFSIHLPKTDPLWPKTNEKDVLLFLLGGIKKDKPALILCTEGLVILVMGKIVLLLSTKENILKE